jgi:hypothetical protein
MPKKGSTLRRCKKGSRRCHNKRCVVTKPHVKTKRCRTGSRKCHDQLCHQIPVAVESHYNLRPSRGTKQ